jgi:peptidoglycan/xylan/chitin deacetylase (PgdA/CDA1 family)
MFWQRHHPFLRNFLIVSNLLLPPACFLLLSLHLWFALWPVVAATLLCHAGILLAIFHPRCPWLGPLVRSFRTEKKEVWLTIDDGPDGKKSAALAEALHRRGVCATFFIIGDRARQHPQAVRAMLAHGHTLANHTLHHPRAAMWCLSSERAREEISGGFDVLREFGVHTSWFRAAVGHKSPELHPALTQQGGRLIAWSAGGRDGYRADPQKLIARILARVHPGGILLLHEARPHTESTVLAVVDALLAKGYTFTIPTDEQLEM